MKNHPSLEFTRNPATGKFDCDPTALTLAQQWVKQLEAEYAANPQKRVVDAIKAALFVPSVTICAGGVEGMGTTLKEAAADFSRKTGGRYTLHFGQKSDDQSNG